MATNLTDSTQIKLVSSAITAYKRKVHITRPSSAKEHVVQLQQLLHDNSSTIEWFNHLFPSNAPTESWLFATCHIGSRGQQGRGGRREILIKKESSFLKKDVIQFLAKQRKGNNNFTLLPGVSSGNTLSEEPSLLATSSHIAPPMIPPLPASTAGHSSILTSNADSTSELEITPPVMTVEPEDADDGAIDGDIPSVDVVNASAAAPAALLLRRLLKRQVSYDKVSRRNKQRVRRILADDICNRIRKSVAVDEENITCSDILRDIADSVDRRSKKRKRADAKQALARQPLVQKLVTEYSSPSVSRKERRRILSTISREFSLKELNKYVFSVNSGVQV